MIAPQSDDYYIRKYVYSGFWDTRLDSLLRNLGIRTLVCAGFAADICLLGTMIDALYRNYRIVLLRDATQAVEIPDSTARTGVYAPNRPLDRMSSRAHVHCGGLGRRVRERRRETVKRSADRILTTHVGSLARPEELLDLMRSRALGEPYDDQAYDEAVRRAVATCVRDQAASGLDSVSDGEQGKIGHATYIGERLEGFERHGDSRVSLGKLFEAEIKAFPVTTSSTSALRWPAAR